MLKLSCNDIFCGDSLWFLWMLLPVVLIAKPAAHTGKTPALPIRYVPIRDNYFPWVSRLYWRKGHIFTEDERIFKTFVENYYAAPQEN